MDGQVFPGPHHRILLPGVGDTLTSVFVLPFIYVAACKVRSIPLTLAVIYNVLFDVAIGMIPFFIGDVVDACNRSYVKNRRLIIGFVEDDKEVIRDVNKKAFRTGILIAVFCVLIYLLGVLVASVFSGIAGLF